jgi:hypothetical protein
VECKTEQLTQYRLGRRTEDHGKPRERENTTTQTAAKKKWKTLQKVVRFAVTFGIGPRSLKQKS